LHYAIGQDNNHATSEASALFIASSWLGFIGKDNEESKKWLLHSRRLLERGVNRLVMKDGTFSQYSTNYHRLLLDSVSLVEYFRIKFHQDEFSEQYKNKIKLAIEWLWQLTDSSTGVTPNLGSNDGAQLLQLAGKDYLDFRPSTQLASALFNGCRLYGVDCNGILNWLDIDMDKVPHNAKNEQSKLFKHGGYVSIVRDSHKGLLRYPNLKFRPCQADFLHLDIMVDGESIISDGGTYSYNKGRKWLNYFSGIESHNTIQFDGTEPMPRLGRFLFGKWPSGKLLSFYEDRTQTSVQVKYQDYLGRSHERGVFVENGIWTITDKASDFSEHAILRWRLHKSNWSVIGNQVVSSKAKMSFEVDKNVIMEIKIVKGSESRYYNEVLEADVIEAKIYEACTIKTTIEFLET